MQRNFIHRPKCELCGSENKAVLISREFTDPVVWDFLQQYYEERINQADLKGGKYEIVKCSDCGFLWQAYILNDDLMKKLYRVWISSEDSFQKKRSADITLYSGYARQVQRIAILLSRRPHEIDVLDFGMGWGYWCLMAKAFGYNVSGYEISREMVEFAGKNGIDVYERYSDIADKKFDFINAEQVFEHIPNPLETLRSLVQRLNSGGIIRISVPYGRNVEKTLSKPRWKPSKNAIHPLEHINCFTHRVLIKLGKSAGLELVRPSNRFGTKNYLKQYTELVLRPLIKNLLRKCCRRPSGNSLYFTKHG